MRSTIYCLLSRLITPSCLTLYYLPLLSPVLPPSTPPATIPYLRLLLLLPSYYYVPYGESQTRRNLILRRVRDLCTKYVVNN